MRFPREDALKRTDVLSGGEASRLLFCRLMLQKPNVLGFDEPTNHLDLESINALNIALQRLQGTVVLLSHDECLLTEAPPQVRNFTLHQQIPHFNYTTA